MLYINLFIYIAITIVLHNAWKVESVKRIAAYLLPLSLALPHCVILLLHASVGNCFKRLMRCEDERFAKHSRFQFKVAGNLLTKNIAAIFELNPSSTH